MSQKVIDYLGTGRIVLILVFPPGHKESCQKFYQAKPEVLSFAGPADVSMQHMNAWVAEGESFNFYIVSRISMNISATYKSVRLLHKE